MSLEERRVWTYAAVTLVVSAVYAAVILARVAAGPVADVDYVRPMLLAIGAALVLNMVVGPHGRERRDERDAEIYRHGEHIGFYVLAAVAAAALVLTLAQFAHFWIANTLYLAFVLNALTSSAVKISAYRRGF
ncbi:hypothetical protein [Streptomonospora halophila]|uniref:hypothetical protein n=1 Tax=Streptomonospora halophila TaxID=427369 RepID=UPI0031E6737A